MTSTTPASPADLRRRLRGVGLLDEGRIGRRLERMRGPKATEATLSEIARAVEAAEARTARRAAAVPTVSYPADLPVSQRHDDLLAAIAEHQVIVVAGETGSGKTTQLPKLCLELGRGVRGRIGHTQPRRIAARSVAVRIAEELGVPLGGAVGYAVRFSDQVSDETAVKVMTDGILLAEIQRDRALLQYDTIIIDEAHERSLTIDFLLGYLKQLLPRRPDLKVIITSATIDPQRFADHFDGAPVVEVSGRTYPVEVRYRPLSDETEEDDEDDLDDRPSIRQQQPSTRQQQPSTRQQGPQSTRQRGPVRDQIEGISDAVTELWTEGTGDILVFLSGEREIRDTADALGGLDLPDTEILPLYARLSTAEQHRVFTAHRGRRIVLATNVAETSLTVPGIRYVVDPDTARISRYSLRTKVQRLPIERISQASARQRAGRCGRTSDGICIHLYSEEDFESRPVFTDPEILRTNLASVILSMTSLGLGDVAAFPFLDPPDRRAVRDGMTLLQELSALEAGTPRDPDGTQKLSAVGRSLAQLPVDPRIGRMILQAAEVGCVREAVVIAAALSIQDPRERPADQRDAADRLHARFADEHSDFLAFVNLWRYLREQQKELSGNQFRRRCREEFLHYLRVREWQDLVSQLRRSAAALGVVQNTSPASDEAVHEALLSGLLSNVGTQAVERRADSRRESERREYLGARNTRFVLSSGSSVAKRPPRWVMAAELVETSRLFGRVVARVDPVMVERLAAHLVVRSYSEPRWDARRGAAVASERVTLYGLPLVTGRTVGYGRVDPATSRELFIRHALVGGEWSTHHRFAEQNRALVDEVRELERRTRRVDLLVDDETLVEFYDRRVPAEVVSVRHFDRWWKDERRRRPELLTFTRELLRAAAVDASSYPDALESDDLSLPITYRFEPGQGDDGVTVHIPLDVLNRVGVENLDWQVPGLRAELVTSLLRSLRKDKRRLLGPAPDRARALLAVLRPGEQPLLPALEDEIERQTGVRISRADWRLDHVPPHLRPRFAVEDEQRRSVATGTDLDELRAQLAAPLRQAVAGAAADLERDDLGDWDFDELPRVVETSRTGHRVQGYPALVDEDGRVAVRVLPSPDDQAAAMPLGLRRLLQRGVPSLARSVAGSLGPRDRLLLSTNPDGSPAALVDDAVTAVIDGFVRAWGGAVWRREDFVGLRDQVRAALPGAVRDLVLQAGQVLDAALAVRTELSSLTGAPSVTDAVADVQAELDRLLPRGFLSAAGRDRVPDLVRYLRAAERRLAKLPREADVDRARMSRVDAVARAYAELLTRLPAARVRRDDVVAIGWLLEELRVSLFAQELRTPVPVSEKRILRAIDAIS